MMTDTWKNLQQQQQQQQQPERNIPTIFSLTILELLNNYRSNPHIPPRVDRHNEFSQPCLQLSVSPTKTSSIRAGNVSSRNQPIYGAAVQPDNETKQLAEPSPEVSSFSPQKEMIDYHSPEEAGPSTRPIPLTSSSQQASTPRFENCRFVSVKSSLTDQEERADIDSHSPHSRLLSTKKGVEPSGVWDPHGHHRDLQVDEKALNYVIVVQNYSSVITADDEQTIFIVIANKSLPSIPLIAVVVPPQEPGELFLTLVAGGKGLKGLEGSEYSNISFQMAHQDTSMGPFLSALPITVIRPPTRRAEPRLAYSKNGRQQSSQKQTQRSGKLTHSGTEDNDFARLIATHPKFKSSYYQIPSAMGSRLDLRSTGGTDHRRAAAVPDRKSETHQDVLARLNELQNCRNSGSERSWINNKSLATELKLVLASLDIAVLDTTIPFLLRASIYFSVPYYNRKAISMFHSQLFKFQPFNVSSAHIYMKSCPEEAYTVFAFTLTNELEVGSSMSQKQSRPLSYVASLDRFEASERLCGDPRFWKYIDGAVPSKNKFTEDYKINTWDDTTLRAPTPPTLIRSRKPYCALQPDSKAQALEIAPLVFLHWEPWPTAILPNLHSVSDTNNENPVDLPKRQQSSSVLPSSTSSSALKTEQSMTQTGTGTAQNPSALEKSQTLLPTHMKQRQTPHYFGVTLCVGKHVYTSCTAVHEDVLQFIINDWLPYVAVKGSGLRQKLQPAVVQKDSWFPSLLSAGQYP